MKFTYCGINFCKLNGLSGIACQNCIIIFLLIYPYHSNSNKIISCLKILKNILKSMYWFCSKICPLMSLGDICDLIVFLYFSHLKNQWRVLIIFILCHSIKWLNYPNINISSFIKGETKINILIFFALKGYVWVVIVVF